MSGAFCGPAPATAITETNTLGRYASSMGISTVLEVLCSSTTSRHRTPSRSTVIRADMPSMGDFTSTEARSPGR